nr:c-type cytochrome [Massilia genomosp. 1]
MVTGATFPGTDTSAVAPAAASGDNPIALGERLFRSATPACTACHSSAPGVNMAGPSLAGLVGRSAALLAGGSYRGKATDVDGYIRESVLAPSAHVVPGPMYSTDGQSFMPTTYAKDLSPEQLTQLVAYLSSLK